MKFSQLKLNGFKSFIDTTIFDIKPGLTGIIGPNGCGKSNLLEALRWVMGASSAKALRADSMENIIFSGSTTRPARNHARVSLVLDNQDFTAPAPYNRFETLEITRHIVRGEESSYRVNGKTVLAKDIKLFFADIHSGANSPALVRQGQVNMLIASKPENRRLILEEAAGVAGLRVRRREAELRLQASGQNLERLQDILVQYEENLSGLKKQAKHAVRYRELSQKIESLEAFLACYQWQKHAQSLQNLHQEVQHIKNHLEESIQQTAQAFAQMNLFSEQQEQKRQSETKMRTELHNILMQEDHIKRDKQEYGQNIARIQKEKMRVCTALERENNLLEKAKKAQIECQQEIENLGHIYEDIQKQKQLQSALEDMKACLKKIEQKYAEQQQNSIQKKSEQKMAEKELYSAEDQLHIVQERLKKLSRQKKEIMHVEKPGETSEDFHKAYQTEKKILNMLNLQKNTLKQNVDILKSESVLDHKKLEKIKLEQTRLQTEKKTLEQILKYEKTDMEWSPVLEQIKIKPGYEKALAAALGDELEAGLEQKALKRWQEKKPQKMLNLPHGIPCLKEFVSAPNALKLRLSQIGVVDVQQAKNILLYPGQKLVSKEGDLWRWDGYTVSSRSSSAVLLRFEHVNRFEKLKQESKESVEQHKHMEQKCQETERKRKKKEAELLEITTQQVQTEQKLQHIIYQRQSRDLQDQTLKDRLSVLSEQKEHICAEQKQVKKYIEDKKAQLQKLSRLCAETADIEKIQAERIQLREELISRQAQKEVWETEQKNRKMHKEKINADLSFWTERISESQKHIHSLKQEQEKLNKEETEVKKQPEKLAQRQKNLLAQKVMCEKELQEISDQFVALQTKTGKAETRARQAEREEAHMRETLAVARTNRENIQNLLVEKEEAIQQNFQCTQQELTERLFSDEKVFCFLNIQKTTESVKDENQSTAQKDTSRACRKTEKYKTEKKTDWNVRPTEKSWKTDQDIRNVFLNDHIKEYDVEFQLKQALKARDLLGPVNLRAETELQEISKKMDRLKKEYQDLTEAVEQLQTGISRINKQGKKQLLSAFEQVNKYFQEMFYLLFAGGEAKLSLTDSEDPLKAGLEIYASPPGKKISILSLMSGGEQALTAIALILAVFLTHPSPLCVLDEVDAPLDDHNVERYCRMIREISKRTGTYFLLITHNPITMSKMDRLYGVSMPEKGVSQLISVDLDRARDSLKKAQA